MDKPSLLLPIRGAYDLDRTLATLTMGAGNPCLRHSVSAAEMTLATPAGGVVVLAQRGADALRVSLAGAGAGWVRPHLPGLFGLLDDATGFAPEGRLRRVVQKHTGLRLPRLPVVSHRLVQVVLQQLISFRDACRGWRRLVLRYGEAVPGGGGLYLPPAAGRLATLTVAEYTACDILPRHARLIRELAKQAAGLERLWDAGAAADSTGSGGDGSDGAADRLSDYLLRQPGVGPWTVGYLRGAGLGDADAVVLGDYGHPHHVAYFFTGKERSDDAEMLRLLEPYRPHRFRVLQHLILGSAPPPRRGPRRARLNRRLR
ncbi:MAG: hypothetical protein AAGB00_01770 [Planctomycetota bacterium]